MISAPVVILTPVLWYWVLGTAFWLCDYFHLFPGYKVKVDERIQGRNLVSTKRVLCTVAFQQTCQCTLAFLGLEFDMEPLSFFQASWRILVGFFLVDTYQYWMHRWIHVNRFLYRHIHRVHHELQHPYALGALYNHPVEGILMDIVGTGLAMLLLGMCAATQLAFACLLTTKTVCDHSGYRLPFDRICQNTSAYHFVHHKITGMRLNLEQPWLVVWDKWMQTSQDPKTE